MDQVQCPVCTLYLHNGMTLESHLDTHPKDQVIKALCNLANNARFGSRTSTPMHSERSYRSRSRSQTPAADENSRWNCPSGDNDRYWRRTPSRTPKPSPSLQSDSRSCSLAIDAKLDNITYDTNTDCAVNQHTPSTYSKSTCMPVDSKNQQAYMSVAAFPSDYDQQYVFYQDQTDDKEVKYSRSADYSSMDNGSSAFSYNLPTLSPNMKLPPPSILQRTSKRATDLTKIVPKTNNILMKSNLAPMPYMSSGLKSMPIVMTAPTAFVQKNTHNNLVMTSSLPTKVIDAKISVTPTMSNNQYNQITTGAFTPGTTVVTQNSQIIYREMVQNVDGKPFISTMPTVLSSHENVTNVAQSSSVYQNVMVLDQFGNASCMYPSQILPKACNTTMYNSNISNADKSVTHSVQDPNKTLIIEVGPLAPPQSLNVCEASTSTLNSQPSVQKAERSTHIDKNESLGPTKGLKILSNIKVEVPVQHHKSLLNTIVDLTGNNETEYAEQSASPGKILPDFEENVQNMLDVCDQPQPSPTNGDSLVSQAFSVIKNVGNPPSYKDTSLKSNTLDSKMETQFSDSCPVPDLICNEKPSISPVSELSENGENSTDHTSLSVKPENSQTSCSNSVENDNDKRLLTQKPHRNNPLRLNNIFVKKHKKILQIKNFKTPPSISAVINQTKAETRKTSSTCNMSDNFSLNKIQFTEKNEGNNSKETKSSSVNTYENCRVSYESRVGAAEIIDANDHNETNISLGEQSMDIEVLDSERIINGNGVKADRVHVKEEINTSNEGGFSNHTEVSDTDITPLETIRPINVISYGNMTTDEFDDESNHKELLELEAASKNKHFVNMMNENYFGDNIYADYFTPDRVESFESEREAASSQRDGQRDSVYSLWGEPSSRENEFVLPNFIHESYKIAENGIDYSEMGGGVSRRDDDHDDFHGDEDLQGDDDGDGDGCEKDNKADVLSESRSEGEASLNICADECMPPRGELSGQESNGDMESSSWPGIYSDVAPAETYDLMARESWASDGSEVDATEKRDNVEGRVFTCSHCGAPFPSLKELRAHRNLAHPSHAGPVCTVTYSRLVTERTIKKEEKTDDNILAGVTGNILTLTDTKEISTTMLQMYDAIGDAKPKIEGFIKQESKRRKKDHVCPTCKVDQVTEAAFNEHLKIHPLECLTCGKYFSRRANLSLHIKMHLGIKNFKCDVCEKRFLTRQKLSEHSNIHTGRSPIKCTICDDTFRRYSNMVQHRDRHHFQKKSKVRYFVCQCGAQFHSRAKLRWHSETHDLKPKACNYCSSKFVHASSLTRHIRRTHNEYYIGDTKGNKENVPCPVCKQVYLRTNLRSHLQTHSGKRPFVCIICNKAFTTKWNLKLHRWTHMSRSAKPFKCNFCSGAFIRQSEYISHMNSHKSVRPYTCNYCGCQFIRKYNCQRHMREHETAKKYVCKVPKCGKSFHRSYYLSEHMKVHSGARPFTCNICGKTSSNKSNHNKHVKIHNAREAIASEA